MLRKHLVSLEVGALSVDSLASTLNQISAMLSTIVRRIEGESTALSNSRHRRQELRFSKDEGYGHCLMNKSPLSFQNFTF